MMLPKANNRAPAILLGALLSVTSLASAGCGASRAVAVAPKPSAVSAARPPPPPCPVSIEPGGDPLEAEAFENKPVIRVCVVGGTDATRRDAQRVIELRPSEVFSAERVRADLEALLRMGPFDDAQAYGLRVQQGTSVVLLYAVHDRPLVADIAFEGAKLLGDAKLDAKLATAKNAPYDPVQVNGVAQAVRDEYHLRGYGAARVVVVTEPVKASPDRVSVRLKVDEGNLWRFTKVEFRGNKKVSEAELRKAAGQEVGQPFVTNEVERATLVLGALYYDRGFVQVRIDSEPGPMTAQGGIPLAFVIEEGDVHSIGTLHVTGLGASVEREVLDKVVRARSKQVFSRSAVVQDIEHVKAFFTSRGQQVEVTPLTEVDPKRKVVDLTFQIDAR